MTRPTLETLRQRAYWRAVPSEFYSLIGLGAPALGFGLALMWAASRYERFAWILEPSQYPWQIWVLILSGTLATAGGIGDWIFHRRYVTVGPKEHHSHLLALLTGGLPVFVLMIIASALSDPSPLLLPIILTVLTFLSTMLAIKLRPGCVDTGDNRFKKKIRSIEEQFERFN